MPALPQISTVVARLVAEPAPVAVTPGLRPRPRLYRPLIVGLALLERRGSGGRWTVPVSADGRLWPRIPPPIARSRRLGLLRDRGVPHRLAAALVTPQDLASPTPRIFRRDHGLRSEFYGWSLLYQLPGMPTCGLIDPNERIDDLPAFYESPQELIDRSVYLAERGVASRPLALVTQPADFIRAEDGRLRNRFYPQERFREPLDLDWLG